MGSLLMPLYTYESALILRRVDIILDAGFKEFYKYCKGQDIPVVIISRYAFPARDACAPTLMLVPGRLQRDGAQHPRGALEPHR